MENAILIFALFSRLPLYIYAGVKAYTLKDDLVVISTFWLGALALSGVLGATASAAYLPHVYLSFFGYMNAISLFMLAKTARKAKEL